MLRIRTLALVYGASVLLWLQLEDNGIRAVAVLGFAGSLLVVVSQSRSLVTRRHLALPKMLVLYVFLGGLAGVVAAVFTAGLMLLKTGLHGHLYPDYPAGLILAILRRAPAWGMAGALAGAGLAFALRALRPGDTEREA